MTHPCASCCMVQVHELSDENQQSKQRCAALSNMLRHIRDIHDIALPLMPGDSSLLDTDLASANNRQRSGDSGDAGAQDLRRERDEARVQRDATRKTAEALQREVAEGRIAQHAAHTDRDEAQAQRDAAWAQLAQLNSKLSVRSALSFRPSCWSLRCVLHPKCHRPANFRVVGGDEHMRT